MTCEKYAISDSGEEFLKKLPEYLGCSYGGCFVKGDNFSIRLLDEDKQKRITKPYKI